MRSYGELFEHLEHRRARCTVWTIGGSLAAMALTIGPR